MPSERRISAETSIRLGARRFRAGQEEELYQQIDAKSAEKLVQRGQLQGDWSGAGGEYQARSQDRKRKQAARSPFGRAFATLYEPREEERGQKTTAKKAAKAPVEDEEEEEEIEEEEDEEEGEGEGYTIQTLTGGWYGFKDANGEPVTDEDGKRIKIQGKTDAERYLESLNAE